MDPPATDSVDSSPRSRTTDTYEPAAAAGEPLPQVPNAKLRLMCSYGGHIVPRPHDKSLCYVGGDTRIVVVERHSNLPELLQRLSKILLNSRPFTLKYQLPNEDLDSLITVSSEEDLENMVDEYDRLSSGPNPAKSSRIRLFLFPTKLDVAASMGPILDGTNKSDDWFMNVLNGADLLQRGFSDPASVNCLLGLEENGRRNLDLNSNEGEGHVVMEERKVIDSSVVETNSSFGSACSAPTMANLPRIRVHVEEPGARVGIEDQFAQMGVQKQEEGFAMMSSPPSNLPVVGVPVGEYTNQEDDRSDHGVPVGYFNQQQPQMMMAPNSQAQNKQITEDLPSPVSVSSDCSNLSNANTRQKPVMYQDPSGGNRVPAGFMDQKMAYTDSAAQIQAQQVADSGYVLPSHYDQLQQQSIQSQQQQQSIQSQQQQQQQLQQQQAQQQQQQQLQQQQAQQHQQQQAQQFIHASNQFVHHHPGGGVPLSYYPVYPSQQPNHQIEQRYPVYYVPAGQQTHSYNLPNYPESANMAPPSSQPQVSNPTYTTTRNMPPPKAEIPQAGIYRTSNVANPQLLQQQQFMGYSQIPHPSQSMAPASSAAYGYEVSDPAHAQVYFTQPMAPQMGAQYQTMNPGPTMVLSDASAANSTDNVKPQVRTSQAL